MAVTIRSRRPAGFTLIELMITVAVVAILAAIAYPSYSEHVRKTRRAEGKALIAEAANRLERCYTRFNAFNAAGCEGVGATASEGGYYELSVATTASTFSLTATPQGPQAEDVCGNLTLSNTGVRGISGSPPEGYHCW